MKSKCISHHQKCISLWQTDLQRPIGEVRLISSNPFDVIGASNAGMKATWVNRSHGLFDTLGEHPAMIVATLEELVGRL